MTFAQLRTTLLFAAIAATACLMPAQADTYWHLRAGQDLFATGRVPLVDSYSHTVPGQPWPNHEWLWQALAYGFFRLGGMPGLVVLGAACATLACLLSFRLTRARPTINFALALVGIALASVVWALRPQVGSLLLLVALVHLLVARRFWFIPLLFLVWANLHGAVALGGAALVTATGVAWFGDRRRFRSLALVTVISGALTAVTPMGPALWTFIGDSMGRSRQNQIMEWLPSYPKGPIEIAFWLAAIALVVMVFRRWRKLETWDDRVVVAIALMLLPLAARAVRNISPFFLLWVPAMSRLIGPDARWPSWLRATTPVADGGEHPRLNAAIAGTAVAGAIITVAMCWRAPLDRLGWQPISPPAAQAISRCPGPLYNRYNEGGFIIWFVPTTPVFVDSRQDPYPAALLAGHVKAETSGDYADLFKRHHIGCAALPPVSPVAKRLLADGWTTVHRDDAWVVLNPPRAPR